jgi:putative aldouronate transport system permease protein
MMVADRSFGSRVFDAVNLVVLLLAGLTCLLPIVHLAAISLSESSAVGGGMVSLWPVRFTLASYVRITEDAAFFRAALISVIRTIVGTTLNMIVTILLAYPLAQSRSKLRYRNLIAGLVVIPMYFHAGLIPTYMVVRAVGLLGSFWALILPIMVPVWSVIILMNFFRSQPKELEEAAIVDGAPPFQILIRIAVPIARPALATIGLFAILRHWNSFFDGLIYLNNPRNYPLQTYLYGQVVSAANLIQLLQEGADSLAQYFSTETIRQRRSFWQPYRSS